MLTSRDIAKRAGVSQATVSRVLRGHPNVHPRTRDKVLQIVRETNYRPNAIARAMKTSQTGTVGIVVARLSNPLYPEMLELLNDRLNAAGCRMIVWDSEGSGEEAAIEAMHQGIVDGVIFTTATAQSKAIYEAIRLGKPVVLVNRSVPDLPCDQITSDNYAGAVKVAEYFRSAGRQRIALISGDTDASTIAERERGFLEALARMGISLPPSLQRKGTISHEFGRRALRSMLEIAEPPDAVFCANDVLAFGALDAAIDAGWKVPEDLWVVGFDDVPMASWSSLSLTTVRQPTGRLVDFGVERLLKRIASQEGSPERLSLPTDLVIRRTTNGTPFRPNAEAAAS